MVFSLRAGAFSIHSPHYASLQWGCPTELSRLSELSAALEENLQTLLGAEALPTPIYNLIDMILFSKVNILLSPSAHLKSHYTVKNNSC